MGVVLVATLPEVEVVLVAYWWHQMSISPREVRPLLSAQAEPGFPQSPIEVEPESMGQRHRLARITPLAAAVVVESSTPTTPRVMSTPNQSLVVLAVGGVELDQEVAQPELLVLVTLVAVQALALVEVALELLDQTAHLPEQLAVLVLLQPLLVLPLPTAEVAEAMEHLAALAVLVAVVLALLAVGQQPTGRRIVAAVVVEPMILLVLCLARAAPALSSSE